MTRHILNGLAFYIIGIMILVQTSPEGEQLIEGYAGLRWTMYACFAGFMLYVGRAIQYNWPRKNPNVTVRWRKGRFPN